MLSLRAGNCLSAILAATMLFCSPSYATEIVVATDYSIANVVQDLIDAFHEYSYEKEKVDYGVAENVSDPSSMRDAVLTGTGQGQPDIVLSVTSLPYDLKYKYQYEYPDLKIGEPFLFATDRLVLYSGPLNTVDIHAGLPLQNLQNFSIADPVLDPYGAATARLLASFPEVTPLLQGGQIQLQEDVTVTYAALEYFGFPPYGTAYGFVGKGLICSKTSGVETYEVGAFHHEYRPKDKRHPYPVIQLTGVTIGRARTADQDAELDAFIAFLQGHGTNWGTNVLSQQYCYRLPPKK